jgi:hypothetical protein
MAQLSPDFTVVNNSHCCIHAGPMGVKSQDVQNDLYIQTSKKCYTNWFKNGTKTEYVHGRWDEVSGYGITQEHDIARTICAKNGDIHINADYGDIYLKARNIYMETKGDKPNGCFLVNANGHMVLTGAEVKVASGTNLCLIGKGKITATGNQLIGISGSGNGWTSACSSANFLSSIMTSNFSSVINGIAQSCK